MTCDGEHVIVVDVKSVESQQVRCACGRVSGTIFPFSDQPPRLRLGGTLDPSVDTTAIRWIAIGRRSQTFSLREVADFIDD